DAYAPPTDGPLRTHFEDRPEPPTPTAAVRSYLITGGIDRPPRGVSMLGGSETAPGTRATAADAEEAVTLGLFSLEWASTLQWIGPRADGDRPRKKKVPAVGGKAGSRANPGGVSSGRGRAEWWEPGRRTLYPEEAPCLRKTLSPT